ncbi:MAG: hypothetical protein QOE46_2739 [Acidobacteriota bacterium]|jgi:hypothetical protein|nr:hypothetical protein [Acidobacteriota bacterium]
MFTGQITIGKVSARCPARTEPLAARMRLAHLLRGADVVPRGFPPHAVLVIRSARSVRGVSLDALSLRPGWEAEVREQVSLNWRRAARPERGVVPVAEEAVLFADAGEWLACLAVAVARREVERHWCWRASLAGSVSSTDALVRTLLQSPRFIPPVLVRLARWGEAARVLGALRPEECGALLSALRVEFDLPRVVGASDSRAARTTTSHDAPTHSAQTIRATATREAYGGEHAVIASTDAKGAGGDAVADQSRASGANAFSREETSSPPWQRWLASAGIECEWLHTQAQRLLSFAAALFHEPALARSRGYAEEVSAFSTREARRDALATRDALPSTRAGSNVRGRDAADSAAPRNTESGEERDDSDRLDTRASTHSSRARADKRDANESVMKRSTERVSADESTVEETARASSVEAEDTDAHAAPWSDVEGCETRLGGALFILNLLARLCLPECFDEDYGLAEHVTGWGLTELLARALLGEECDEFENDPLWDALARLDGRAGSEPPAYALRVGQSYRVPARWLKLFAPREEAWLVCEEEERLILRHTGGFIVAVCPLEGHKCEEVAARVVEEYVAQGVAAPRLEEWRTPREGAELSLPPDVGAELSASADRFPSFKNLSAYDARLSADVRRWMGWTFPFVRYALARVLAEEETETDLAVREMIVRRGRLYCTATHVDLVMEMNGVSFAARRGGLDASPGWVRDLVRAVAFHYE